ncbi:hypothetical protein M413DRAFT_437927 [Hebeloma cylindrosporum]|uniref:Ribosomal protein mS38 C-terminal domain-containing protein n=1 Tax=Hebeloma cylindrosporum TaxID=76867 RepID=A0A0C3CX74_HEBCY|nr:hypothetical protein M413DRAFT_437927 [Hebeloma cylindrosporum h7]
MSALSRFIIPSSRRSCSSYFSSKSGGGRYFNLTKPPKNPVVATNNKPKNDSPAEVQSDKVQSASAGAGVVGTGPIAESPSTPNAAPSESSSSGGTTTTTTSPLSLSDAFAEFSQQHVPQQLAINSKDFKIHQFFSLHRPLLLISQPGTIFRPAPPNHPIFSPPQEQPEAKEPAYLKYGLDAPLDPFIDADAEAARQLTRALTMSKAGSMLAWENTLKHLGIDVSKDADRMNLQQQFDKEWEEVLLDSTKRKRRKKMKKHKLRKRRRATRSERLRLK